jgi:hypothetical protein
MADDGEELVSASTPKVPVQTDFNPLDPAVKGVHTAMQLAAYKEQIDQNRQKLDMAKEQHQQMALDKFMDIAVKAGKVKGPAQKALFNAMKTVAPMAGIPHVSDDFLSVLQSEPDKTGSVFAALQANPKGFAADPSKMQDLVDVAGGDAAQAFDWVNKAVQPQYHQENAGITATTKAGTEIYKANLADRQKREAMAATAAGKGVKVLDANGNFSIDAANASADEIRDFASQKAAAATTNAEANAEYKKAYIGAYDRRTQAMKDRIFLSLGMQQKRLANGADNQVASYVKPQLDVVGQADRGLDLLNRGAGQVRWADLNEANIDLVGLLQNGKGVIPVSRAAALAPPKGVKGALEQIYSKISGKEVGGPSEEELGIIKDRLSRVREEVAKFHDTKLAQSYKAKSTAGALSADVAQQLFDARKINDASVFGAPGTRSNKATVNPPAATPPAAAGSPSGGNPGSPPSPAPGAQPAAGAPAQLKPATPAIIQKAKDLSAKGVPPDQIQQTLQKAGFSLPPGSF